jgi:hypothetical protein
VNGFKPCPDGCVPDDGCCDTGECGANEQCVDHTCQWVSGFKPCGEACVLTSACCTSNDCDPNQFCLNGTCVARRCGAGAPCRVFITSTAYSGDLREGGTGSGIGGADAKCQARAQAVGLTGTYKAWLSGSTAASSPSQRFTNTANTGPYVLPDADATVIAVNWAELTSGFRPGEFLRNPILQTEVGPISIGAVA